MAHSALRLRRASYVLYPFDLDAETPEEATVRRAELSAQNSKLNAVEESLTVALIILRLRSDAVVVVHLGERLGAAADRYKQLATPHLMANPRLYGLLTVPQAFSWALLHRTLKRALAASRDDILSALKTIDTIYRPRHLIGVAGLQ